MQSYAPPKWQESQLWESHLDVAPVEKWKVYYKGEGGGFPQVQVVVSLVSLSCPWLVLTPKVLQLHTNHLVLVLYRFVWVNEACQFFLVPSRSSSTPLYPSKVLWVRECAPTPYSSIVLSLDSHLSPSRSLGSRQPLSCFVLCWMVKDAEGLIVELDAQFLEQTIMDVIVYPQYWLQAYANVTFPWHLEVLKNFYCSPRPCAQPKDDKFAPMVHTILSSWNLDVQQGLFELTMKSNVIQTMAKVLALASENVKPTIINPFTHMCRVIHAS